MIDSPKVLRAARLEAKKLDMPDGWQSVAMILAGWCAALIRQREDLIDMQSSGYLRRGLPPVNRGAAARALENAEPHPTRLGDGS